MLVCILNNKYSTWEDNLKKFLPWLNITDNWEIFKKLPNPRLLLTHFEELPKIIPRLSKYKHLTWTGIDEAHRIANRNTKQAKAAAKLSWVPRRLILTGTPIEKEAAADLFAQFRFLEPSIFGDKWKDFEDKFMEFDKVDMDPRKYPPGSNQWKSQVIKQGILRSKAVFKEGMFEDFIERTRPVAIRLTKEDVGILPPQVHQVLIPLRGQQRRVYEDMDKHSVARLDNGAVVVGELEITTIMKRRQIASGFVYDEDEETHRLGDAKLRRLITLAKQLPKPIVVFTAFRPDNARITSKLKGMGYDVISVTGSTKKKLRPEIWRKFQKADYDFIVCQSKTGGVGVDLWKSSHAIVHSMSHSFRDWDQLKARLDSRDKEKPSQIYVLCAENTIDEDLYELVVVKALNGDKVLNQLKRRTRLWRRKTKARGSPKLPKGLKQANLRQPLKPSPKRRRKRRQ